MMMKWGAKHKFNAQKIVLQKYLYKDFPASITIQSNAKSIFLTNKDNLLMISYATGSTTFGYSLNSLLKDKIQKVRGCLDLTIYLSFITKKPITVQDESAGR